ncbi:MAG: TonB-dependent receptor [Candidatus Riflebacteria bacterium]|nr:TonB-dependent receptor [Candidatus Riflebacteria bacterium]
MFKCIRFSFFLFSFFLLLFPAAILFAEPASSTLYCLEPVVVEAMKWQPATEFANSPSNVISGEEMKQGNPVTLSDLMDGIMGISVPTSGGPGRAASPVSGGFSGPRVRVMLDGMPLNDPLTGTPDFSDIDPETLMAIETAKGAGSGLWTSGGAGGVVNLTSGIPTSQKFRLEFDGIGGTGQSFRLSDSFGATRVGVNAGRFQTPGWSAADSRNGNTERDSFSRERLGLTLDGRISEKLEFSFLGSWQNSFTDLDGYSFALSQPADDENYSQRRDTERWVLKMNTLGEKGEWKFYFGSLRTATIGIDSDNIFNEYDFSSIISKQAVDYCKYETWGEWTAGAERQETTANNAGLYNLSETEGAFRAGMMAPLSCGWRFRGIIRLENPPMKSSENVTTGRVAFVKEDKNHDIRVTWGRAFRSPAMNERYYPGYGNPKLIPEDARTWNLEFTQRFMNDKFNFSVAVKDTAASDLISTVSTTDPAYPYGMKAGNVDKAKVRSHSFMFGARFSEKISLNAEAEIIDKAENDISRKMLPRVPENQYSASMKFKSSKIDYVIRHRRWGKQWDDSMNTASLGESNRWDIDITGKFNKGRAMVSLLNLFNSHEQRILGYGEPGRRVAASLEFDLD